MLRNVLDDHRHFIFQNHEQDGMRRTYNFPLKTDYWESEFRRNNSIVYDRESCESQYSIGLHLR